MGADRRDDDTQAGIDSVETGMRVVKALSRLGGSQTLTAIATASGLPPPRAHRYLVSLVRSEMVERDSARGYRLGPAAISIGVSALASVDALQLATEAIGPLRDRLGHAVALMVWGRDGPVIVRAEETREPVSLRLRVGESLPVTASASGLVLAAYRPWAVVQTVIERELARTARAGAPAPSMQRIERQLAEARRRGMARIVGSLTPGITALAAPVLDAAGQAVLSVSIVAPSAGLDSTWGGVPARALQRTCAHVSARLGYEPPSPTGCAVARRVAPPAPRRALGHPSRPSRSRQETAR